MSEPRPLTRFEELMVRTYYGRRTLQWIGDRLGCSAATVVSYAKELGLWQPIIDETRVQRPPQPLSVAMEPIPSSRHQRASS